MLQGIQHARVYLPADDAWTYDRINQLVFSRLGTPIDNAHIETINGSLQEECKTLTGSFLWKMRTKS